MNSIDQQFVEYIIKSLVGNPEAVKVDRKIDEKGVLLELTVDPEDLGRVIGKRGATAQSLRTLLRALGTKNDARYNLKIIDTGPPPVRDQTDSRSTLRDEPLGSDSKRGQRDDDQIAAAEAPATQKSEPGSTGQAADDTTTDNQPADTSVSDDIDMTEDEELPESASESTGHSSVIDKTRKELKELDDLDV